MYNMAGRMVRNVQYSSVKSSIDFSGLSAGSYFLRTETPLGVEAVRIVYLP